jgi:hypothetical protein
MHINNDSEQGPCDSELSTELLVAASLMGGGSGGGACVDDCREQRDSWEQR